MYMYNTYDTKIIYNKYNRYLIIYHKNYFYYIYYIDNRHIVDNVTYMVYAYFLVYNIFFKVYNENIIYSYFMHTTIILCSNYCMLIYIRDTLPITFTNLL